MPCPAVLLTRPLMDDLGYNSLFKPARNASQREAGGGCLGFKVLYGLKQGIEKLLGVFLFKARKCHPEICFA